MNEQESIQRAYSKTVEPIFKVFFGEFTSAHGDLEAEQGAKERFRPRPTRARLGTDLGAVIPFHRS